MRPRDPRRLLRRRPRAPARVAIHEPPESGAGGDGSVTTRQVAEVTLPRAELERIWTPESLERLARAYWRYLTRVSLGLLRVLYTETSREVALLGRPFVLLRFHAPEYDIAPDRGTVTWRIDRGLLVAPSGRGKGYLRISVERPAEEGASPNDGSASPGDVTVKVSSEVASFYPLLAATGFGPAGSFSRVGRVLYGATQLRMHVLVTNGFLRSLARLELAPSVVGRLSPPRQPIARR